MVSKGKHKASNMRRADVLLASDETSERQSETFISLAYCLSIKSVERIRRQFCERGIDIFTSQPRQSRSDKKIDGSVEAHILAVSCSEPLPDKLLKIGARASEVL
jgi:hypothetical protein